VKKLITIFLNIILRVLYIKPFIQLLKKHKLILIILFTILLFIAIQWLKDFKISEFLEYKKNLLILAKNFPIASSFLFFLSYLAIATVSLPGVIPLSIIGGFLFGFVKGSLLSILAVTTGSCLAFLIVRHLFRNFFIKKTGNKTEKIYSHLRKNEIYYLFALSLSPFIPLLLTNIIMGLSSIRLAVFFVVSLIALLPQVAIYTNFGSQVAMLESLHELAEPNMILAFSLIGLFPLVVKYLFKIFKKIQKPKDLMESKNVLQA